MMPKKKITKAENFNFTPEDKRFLEICENGDHDSLEKTLETKHISSQAISQGLFRLCEFSKTSGNYLDCVNKLIKYTLYNF